jgi:gamma-glutamyltranspeptidase/glutathione hydrolase
MFAALDRPWSRTCARHRLLTVALPLALLVSVGPTEISAAAPPAARGRHGMVASPDALATQVGVAVLKDGGNAVDAAVAVALALAVTYPEAGNLGGGGFLLYRDAQGEHHALDFRETAPDRLQADMFLDEEGRPVPERSLKTGLAVGVPGTVAGLVMAHERWGSKPWAELVAPAVALARDGFRVSAELAASLSRKAELLLGYEETRRSFAPKDRLPLEGERWRQRDLAASLEAIARRGAAGFYRGPVASAVARTVREHGGVMTQQDLRSYRPRVREPIVGRYRGHRVVVFPPPSSGGVALLQILGMLESFDLRALGFGSSAGVHGIVETERRAFADRARWLGDPDFFDVPVQPLIARDYLDRRLANFDPQRATPSSAVAAGRPHPEGPGETLHFSVADRHGGAVAATVTLNLSYGCGLVASGTGILLNNEIDDFAMAPGVPNYFGLLGGEANAVAGGKRPLSSMSPTIVESPEGRGRPLLVLGSPGGSRIITSVAQVLINVIDHRMPLQEAVNAPRFHHQWQPDVIRHEPRAFPSDVADALVRRGHVLQLSDRPLGNVNAIGLDEDGSWLGAADPRRQGRAAGF